VFLDIRGKFSLSVVTWTCARRRSAKLRFAVHVVRRLLRSWGAKLDVLLLWVRVNGCQDLWLVARLEGEIS
jgi:hypothetical protein